jgi:hypothetical protein
MPKIADIQETPNPNAVKFILKEPVSHGTSHSFDAAEKAAGDKLAKSLFEIGEVVSVFYMDKMITVEKTDEADWDEILPALAVPIRAAETWRTEMAMEMETARARPSAARLPARAQRRPASSRKSTNCSTNEFARFSRATAAGWKF